MFQSPSWMKYPRSEHQHTAAELFYGLLFPVHLFFVVEHYLYVFSLCFMCEDRAESKHVTVMKAKSELRTVN